MTDEQLVQVEDELALWAQLSSELREKLGTLWADEFHMYAKDLIVELRKTRRERDLAIAHDTQDYPTAEAYERVCDSLAQARVDRDAHRQRANENFQIVLNRCEEIGRYRQVLEQIAGIVYNVSMTGERTAAEQRIGEIVFSALNQVPPER